jgi:hypothetical protein
VKHLVCGAIALCLIPAAPLRAQNQQNQTVNDLKGKIFDARMAKQTFANGVKFCPELNGTNFYFQPRDRVLNLEEYQRSLESLAKEHIYNPEKRRPWTDEDAHERWEHVKQQAIKDQASCQLVAALPDLEKRLEELEKSEKAEKADKAERKPAAENKPEASEKKN